METLLEFVIPLSNNDLLHPDYKSKGYNVDEILSERDIRARISNFTSSNRTIFIYKEFDTFFSVFSRFDKLEPEVTQTALNTLTKNFKFLHAELASNLDKTPSLEWKRTQRIIFKMSLYLLCIFTEKFESESMKPSTDAIITAKGKGRAKTKVKNKNTDFTWDEKKEKIVQIYYEIFQLPIFVLWDPPVIEEEVINILTNCMYKLLENTNFNHNKQVRDGVFNLLGLMVAKYNHGLSCGVKIMQLLQQYEYLAIPLAQLLDLLVKKHSAKSVVGDVVREIVQMSEKSLYNDATATRTICAFLVELTQQIPTEIMNYLSILVPLLEQEPYSLRNCVLTVIAEIILKLLSKEDLNDKQKTLRDQLLDYLTDHVHDVNAFVRSRALQLWTRLVEQKAVPLNRQHMILKLDVGRLNDKSNNVRKNAVHLVTALLKCNPFASKFSKEELEKNYEQEKTRLNELRGSMITDVGNNLPDQDKDNEKNFAGEENVESVKTSGCEDSLSHEILPEVPVEAENPEILKQQRILLYLEDSIKFIDLISKAIPLIVHLLNSRQSADALAAIEFFGTAYEFGLKESVDGIRKMLILAWTTDATIKEAVIDTYKRLYLQSNSSNQHLSVVKNLTKLAMGASVGELTSLEELVCSFVKSGLLNGTVYQVLWERYTCKVEVTKQERRIAALLIGMVAREKLDLVKSNIEILTSYGFGIEKELDFHLAKETCVIINKLTLNKNSIRYPKDDQIFTRLVHALVTGVINVADRFWIPFMEKGVKLIYNLGDQPDEICSELLKKLATGVLKSKTAENKYESSAPLLTRLIATAGHIALCHLIYLDCNVFTEIKRRQEEQQKRSQMKNKRKSKRQSICATATLTPTKNLEKSMGEEELMTGADTDDAEADLIRNILDNETVTGENLLAAFAPVVVEICAQFSKFIDSELRVAAATALAKFMMVGSGFCEDKLQLLVTLMEKSTNDTIRENLVIAMGDLIIRFPNVTAPWAGKLYNRLRDDSVQVRLNTLTVLSHLTFNDMIKARGQISDVATCMVDENARIAEAAKLFFNELANKGTTIYNMLPDIISRLSDPEVGTEENKFRIILKHLIGLLQKDRQFEGLVEKLCHRFRASNLERQWHDLAYCMSLLSYSYKSLQKLTENFTCYGNKLTDPFVLECFRTILNNAKKLAKPEVKNVIQELEQKIEGTVTKGLDEQNPDKENLELTVTKPKTRPKKVTRKSKKKLSEEFESPPRTSQKRRLNSTRTARSKPKVQLIFSSDSEE